jgi:hypothetical protein
LGWEWEWARGKRADKRVVSGPIVVDMVGSGGRVCCEEMVDGRMMNGRG